MPLPFKIGERVQVTAPPATGDRPAAGTSAVVESVGSHPQALVIIRQTTGMGRGKAAAVPRWCLTRIGG